MKRIFTLLMIIVTVIAIVSCGKLKQYPAGPIESAAGGPDNSTYPFESQADVNMFSLSGTGFTALSYSTDVAYEGTGCVKLDCNFNAPNTAQGRLAIGNVVLSTLVGKTITAAIWVPLGMDSYGGFFYFQLGASGNYAWYQSPWININPSNGAVPGIWNVISADVNSMTPASGSGTAGTIADTTQTITWGVVVGQGSTAPNYKGPMYIDSINIK
jgi:hypothetical protein